MGRYRSSCCYVFGCKSRAEIENDDTTFHRFPKDRTLRNAWVAATGREAVNFINARICSKHFEQKCFKRTKKLTVLLSGSVPTICVQSPGPVLVPSMTPSDAAEKTRRTGRPRVVEPLAPVAPLLRSAVRPRGAALTCLPIKVTSGPSLKSQGKISLEPDFNPVITNIKSEADLIKQEDEDPQSDDTLSLAEDADQLSDADQPSEDLIPLSNAQVPLSNAPDPLSDVNVEKVVVGVDEVEVTRPVIKSEADLIKQEDEDPQIDDTLSLAEDAHQLSEDLIPLNNAQVSLINAPETLSDVNVEKMVVGVDEGEVTRPAEETRLVELTRSVALTAPVEFTMPVEETRAVEEPTVPLPLHLRQELSRAGNDCYNLISIQGNQINKLRVRCGKQLKKLHSYGQIIRRRDKRISNLCAEVEALRSFIAECGCEVSSSGGGKQNRSSNTVVGQKKPNRQLLIVKRDYKPPKSSVSIPDTLDVLQKSTVCVKRTLDNGQNSSVSIPDTSDVLQKSSVGVKRTLDIRPKLSSGIPDTSNARQKSSVGVKPISDIRNNPLIAVQPVSIAPQTSVGLQHASDIRQNALVIQIDGMHNTVLQPKLVRLDDSSMETG